jgi:hypothetical protein
MKKAAALNNDNAARLERAAQILGVSETELLNLIVRDPLADALRVETGMLADWAEAFGVNFEAATGKSGPGHPPLPLGPGYSETARWRRVRAMGKWERKEVARIGAARFAAMYEKAPGA